MNLENKEIKLDMILIGKNRVLDISKQKSIESKQGELGSKSSVSFEPINKRVNNFQNDDGLCMIDIAKGIQYYGKTTKFKNFKQHAHKPQKPLNLKSQRVLSLRKIKEDLGKPVDTKAVIESSKSYHGDIKKKAKKFFSEVNLEQQANQDLGAETARIANILSSGRTFAHHERPFPKVDTDAPE